MKKIQLTDGLPSNVLLEDQSDEVVSLVEKIATLGMESGLSYVEINKALYLADKGLYINVISGSCSRLA